MKVILLQDVRSLGKKGDIVEVNDGYARNFLLKTKKGVEANNKNMNDLKLHKANQDKIAQEQLEAARELGRKLEESKVTVSIKTGEGGRAFGSVSSKEIAAAAQEQLGQLYEKALDEVGEDNAAIFEIHQMMLEDEDIAAAAQEQLGLDIDKKKVQLKEQLKSLGTFHVPVKLHPKVTAELTVIVVEEA